MCDLLDAQIEYLEAKKELEEAKNDPEKLKAAAQKLNDRWVAYKKAETEAQNKLVYRRLNNYYDCRQELHQMPLKKGKSKKAFKSNVATETKALEAKGKSPKKAVKQAVAIAYSKKREKK